jgi:hypothetical protein
MSSSHYMRQEVKGVGYVGVQITECGPYDAEQSPEMQTTFDKIRKVGDNEAGKLFAKEVLPM